MSQPTLTNFFQARKHLPQQQAAKKRKIVLEKHQIQDILENEDSVGTDSSEEEEEFKDCCAVNVEEENVLNEKDNSSSNFHEDDDEFKDCVEQHNALENNPESEHATTLESENTIDFIEDETWESLAIDALDATADDKNTATNVLANDSNKSDRKVNLESSASETTSYVVTSAIDNNRSLRSEGGSVRSFSQELGTPSPAKNRENFRKSKKDEKEEHKWTPKKVSEPLFTIGYREPQNSAKKRLNLSDKSRNVVFQKLSNLSPIKKKLDSPKNINYENLSARLTPTKSVPSPLKKPSIAKNLFSDSPETVVKPDLSKAIEKAKILQAKATPAEVKAKLGKVKLADLKSRLASLSSSSLKVGEIRAAAKTCKPPKITSSITLELDIPPSPSKTVPPSPHKSPYKSQYKASPRKLPAYQRFHNLARPADRTLPLPYSYKMLAEVFRCSDTVVSMLHNRKEVINLDKLSKNVADLLQKKWQVKFLKQILCVFPQAYKVEWKRVEVRMGVTSKRELQIRPNMSYKRDLLEDLDGNNESHVKMLPQNLVERRDIFRNSLLEMVKDNHEEFLAALDPPITADRNALTSWHKDYDVDAAPEVDTVELPEEPGKVAADALATEVSEKAKKLAEINPKLSNVLRDSVVKVEEVGKYSLNFSSPSKINTGLEGLNPTLIAKIKAKEAAKAKLEMTRNPEQIKRISQLKKLPELARLIRNLFISEKKAALEVQFACKRLTESMPYGTEKRIVEENLRLLTIETRGWLKVHMVGCAEYFKMDKTDINKVCQRLELKLRDEQEM